MGTVETRTLSILTVLSTIFYFVSCQVSVVPVNESTPEETKIISAPSSSSQESALPPKIEETTGMMATFVLSDSIDRENLVNNHDPVFKQKSYSVNVEESTPIDTVILSVVAVDKDSGVSGHISYKIEASTSVQDTFSVNKDTGQIVLSEGLNRTRASSYTFEIVAFDRGVSPRHGTANVEVLVINSNSRPYFQEAYYEAKVREDAPIFTSVLHVVAIDENAEGSSSKVIYSFEDESSTGGLFAIQKTTGVIMTIAHPNWNNQNKYVMVVQALDQGAPQLSDTTTVYITIIKSDISTEPVHSDETFTGGDAFFATGHTKSPLSGRDDVAVVDTPSDISMTMVTSATAREVTTSAPAGTPPPNVHYPVFTQTSYYWTVAEDAEIGSVVAVVTASDKDDGISGQVTYSIEPEDILEFTVDEGSGTVKVASSLAESRGGSLYFNIIASDLNPDPKSSMAEVEVIIADINNHRPQFERESYEARVREDALRYSRVMQISATDADTGANGRIRYTFQTGKDGGGAFGIDRSLGIIRILRPLDRELRSEYDLVVEASDSGVPKHATLVEVRITITDVNDNAPKFSSYYIRLYIRENSQPFQLVGTVEATDADDGRNAEIRYAMPLDTVDAYQFQLDYRTGNLHALNSLDREEQHEYRLTVRAASPPLFAQAVVIVYVLDENDNPPVAYNSTIYLNYYGDYLPEGKIGHLGALDPDVSDELSFEFQDDPYLELFLLNRSTGELHATSKILTQSVPRVMTLTVGVSDGVHNTTAEVIFYTARVSIDMLINSISLHLVTKIHADKFIATKTLQSFIDIVASILDTKPDDVFILSMFDEMFPYITSAINMTLVARMRNGTYYSTAQLRARIALDQLRLWTLVGILPPVDKLCSYETCDPWIYCKGVPAYRYTVPTLISASFSFRSIKWEREYHCICPPGYSGRRCSRYYDFCNDDPCQRYGICKSTEQGAKCVCQDGFVGDYCDVDMSLARCPTNVCKNNGTCVESHFGGFHCSCPAQIDGLGRLCEQTTRTFSQSGSFMAFEELGWHSELNIKLSFRTHRNNGLILYNARSHRRLHDFIALEVVNRQLVFSFSLGELYTRVYAGLIGGVSDGEWHNVQINYVRQHVLLGIDGCIHWVETIEPDEFLQQNIGNYTCLGYEAQSGGLKNLRFFDLDGPFFLGAAQVYWFSLAVPNKDFVGCIRDVYVDYQRLDLSNYIQENNTFAGCDLTQLSYRGPCEDRECNQADEPIRIGPVRQLKMRVWFKAIQVIWKPPKYPSVPVDGYEVRYTEVYGGIPSDNWMKVLVDEGDASKKRRRQKFRRLAANTMYTFHIRAYGGNVYGEEVRVNATTLPQL